ncbi:putative trehalose synthase [Pseudomonas saudimassiliensis]|uniref:maltose alpha-D-glucosyltransferase n=1 Tax=Pseudomonas saudimassiliensis TaxID=1461581 RepID=A0A078MBJ9_9PSED|nr:maltose alpha-D-glucosyltransferase [Pseudomonas saudimassiliensis]CEA02076.1 putative trehalose synthase [Pseudomonas saudimassiliensis]CEF25721.1 putative trehalose synthase [Pseudomonas saudimassiliensis]
MARRARAPAFLNDPCWYKDAIIYQIHVKSFFDANNDGIGDFAGLIQKLDYIVDLGVNTLWLLPFYPSPRRDDGYDIADYRGVHPDYGTMADVRRFIREAHKRGLRVITELVINHTSDQHPWFQRARHAPKGSPARNFYVWSDTDQIYQGTRIIFLDTEKSNWTWDPVAGQFFWHRFYSHQPDLNFDNPQVLRAVLSVMRYWLDMGVDGMRLDAIPYLIERDGTNNENLPETHEVLKKIRAELDAHYPDRMLLAEANQWPEDTQLYFGGEDGGPGDECHMAFHFPLMPRMYMAIAQEDRFPITDILRQTPEIPENCQWAIFLRNHDELTLEMVTDRERDYLWNYYAADRRARINLGIRRRLAPLVERDRRRIELLNSLLLSMPGTPTLYYGDEIGMGDNIFLGDRDGVRTPMQWSTDRNGGFSRADPASMVLPPIMDPLYGYQTVNVEAQARDAHSLLNWTRRMLTVRKQQQAFGRGTLKMLAPANRKIIAYLREFTTEEGRHELILCVANLSRAAQATELDLSAWAGKVPVEMLGGSSFPPIGQLPYLLTLPPYGFYWFVLADESQMPSWHTEPVQPMPELATLVIKHDMADLLKDACRRVLERETLPQWLGKRRWFSAPAQGREAVRLLYVIPFCEQGEPCVLCEIAVGDQHYQIPLGYLPEDAPSDPAGHAAALALARLRRGPKLGLLTDAAMLPGFTRKVIDSLRQNQAWEEQGQQIRFIAGPKLAELEDRPDEEILPLAVEQSNSSVLIGERMMLKVIRRVMPGVHPEIEVGSFLTEREFPAIAPLLGQVQRIDESGEIHTLMILQGYVDSQGDAWQWTRDTLERAIRDQLAGGMSEQENQFIALAELESFAGTLGRRLGQMHLLLADPEGGDGFGYVIADEGDCAQWAAHIREQLDAAFDAIEQPPAQPDTTAARQAAWLLERRAALGEALGELAQQCAGGVRIRVHGDLHLGQVLVVQGDACFIDFEGEPTRSLEQRRERHSPMKDVTGMLRSFDYAAAMALRSAHGTDHSEQAQEARQQICAAYREQAVAAFLEAYLDATTEMPHRWSEQGVQAALTLFSIEKAAYEVSYEASYRPEWLDVPLEGLTNLCKSLTENGIDEPWDEQ